MSEPAPAVLGFAAWSGTGKTTLLRRLIPVLRERGLRVGVLKHAHHTFDVDHAGKDSFELRHDAEPALAEVLSCLPPAGLDLILVEGFKHERFPKVELHRPALGRPLLYPDDPSIVAVAADAALSPAPALPLLDLNDVDAVADFVRDFAAGATR